MKGGVFANANERAQTQTNADFRLSEKGPKTQVNARKREQTETNANKRKSKNYTPFYASPFFASPRLCPRDAVKMAIFRDSLQNGHFVCVAWEKSHLAGEQNCGSLPSNLHYIQQNSEIFQFVVLSGNLHQTILGQFSFVMGRPFSVMESCDRCSRTERCTSTAVICENLDYKFKILSRKLHKINLGIII